MLDMAPNSSTTNIQDDWEEIQPMLEGCGLDSDAASVQSIDDESIDFDMDVGKNSPSDSPTTATASVQSEPLTRYITAVAPENTVLHTSSKVHNDDEGSDVSVHSAQIVTEDLLDLDIDPPLLLSSISGLTSTLVDTISSTSDLNNRLNDHNLEWILSQCRTLFRLLSDLELVVKCYASAWNPDSGPSSSIPLDPALYKWTSDCMQMLLGLHGAVQEEAESIGSLVPDTYELSMDVLQYIAPLLECKEKMENFLPIMKVDLNEHQTANLTFPAQQPSSNFHHIGRHRNFDPIPVVTGPVPTLRKELYTLKDNITDSIQAVNDWYLTIARANQPSIADLQTEQNAAFTTLSTHLTNHGSDWIDQSLGGGLSYEEFCRLDLDEVKAFAWEFKLFSEEVRMTRIGVQYQTGKGGRGSEVEEAQLNEKGVKRLRGAVKGLNILLKARVEYD